MLSTLHIWKSIPNKNKEEQMNYKHVDVIVPNKDVAVRDELSFPCT